MGWAQLSMHATSAPAGWRKNPRALYFAFPFSSGQPTSSLRRCSEARLRRASRFLPVLALALYFGCRDVRDLLVFKMGGRT